MQESKVTVVTQVGQETRALQPSFFRVSLVESGFESDSGSTLCAAKGSKVEVKVSHEVLGWN